jgi:hypothetical protein
MHATRTPLEIELLISADARRPSAIEKVIDFRKSIAVPDRTYDEIDLDAELDDHLQVDPYAGDPPGRRSDKELGRLLDLLDSLGERGNG